MGISLNMVTNSIMAPIGYSIVDDDMDIGVMILWVSNLIANIYCTCSNDLRPDTLPEATIWSSMAFFTVCKIKIDIILNWQQWNDHYTTSIYCLSLFTLCYLHVYVIIKFVKSKMPPTL